MLRSLHIQSDQMTGSSFLFLIFWNSGPANSICLSYVNVQQYQASFATNKTDFLQSNWQKLCRICFVTSCHFADSFLCKIDLSHSCSRLMATGLSLLCYVYVIGSFYCNNILYINYHLYMDSLEISMKATWKTCRSWIKT